MPIARQNPVEPLLAAFHARQPIRAWSLIVTIFGDVIAPRGGEIGMRALTGILAAIGIDNGVVRTAMSRLASDGWVNRVRQGRLSFYALSRHGWGEVEAAAPRIYGEERGQWEGRFTLVSLGALAEPEPARRRLLALGFAPLGGPVWIAPTTPWRDLTFIVQDPILVEALCLDARPLGNLGARHARSIWQLDPLGDAWGRLTDLIEPLAKRPSSDPLQALTARILLVHEYRRIALRDPGLPISLYPMDWPGHDARLAARSAYRRLAQPSEAWLDQHGATRGGPMPPASLDIAGRFR
jgi:phenylacetic acid degradation operon negative regulatory protein